MQVTETLSEGLKREFRVVVPASELDAKVNARLDEIKARVNINGFRPGKVPVANNQIVGERGYKLASDPKVKMPEEQGAIEQLIAGQSDLDYTVAVEIVPPIALADFKQVKLEKLTSDVS